MYSSEGAAFHTAFQWAIFHTLLRLLSPIGQQRDTVQALLHFHGAEFLCTGVVLSRAAYGDPSLGLTPLINSARRSAEPHEFDWLAAGDAHWKKARIGSDIFFIREYLDDELTP